MNKKITLLSVLMIISSAAAIIQVSVHVSSAMDGRIPHFNIPREVNNTPQSFLVVWENTGSIGCGFRLRADVYEVTGNKTRQVYTAWSEETPIEPGGQADLITYWYPKDPGNFTVKTFLYYCNTIGDGPIVNFTVFRLNITPQKIPVRVTAVTDRDYIEFKFNSNENIDDLIIIPREYPIGWIFNSKRVDRVEGGKEKTVRVDYEASIWKERNVSFDIVTLDGGYYQSREIALRQKSEFPLYQAIIVVLVIVILILSIVIVKGGVEFGDRKGSDGDSGSR